MIEYQVGGSLAVSHPTYIERQADSELYAALLNGEFCYILTCRQMGKSSLRLQMKHRIQAAQHGQCASIDMTRVGSENITSNQWYRGIAFEILRNLKLGHIDLTAWWAEQGNISPIQKLGQLLETIVMTWMPGERIFIFLDEIGSIKSLNFPVDDFFALIRHCYNQRAECPAYVQLTWALFGATSPNELIEDSGRTPFNIGTAIALPGFTLEEAYPLLQGLVGVVENPQAVLATILQWTEGQPFLTQKVCRLVQQSDRLSKDSPIAIPQGTEALWVENLIRSHIIQHWEIQDEPEHLRTIRSLLLHNSAQAGRLLGIYQRILCSNGGLSLELTGEADEWMPLTLSGLVVRSGDMLIVRNRIYSEVFSLDWVKQQLTNLRPYSDALEAWVDSGYQDDSKLLQEHDLYDAQAWTVGKSLSDLDYQFLAASQLCDRRRRERRIVEILSVLSYRSGELEPYLRQIALAVSELLNLDWSVVTLCQGNDERILASNIDIGAAADEAYSLHGALTGYMFHTGSPLFVEDAVTCKDYGNPPDGYRAYLGVPLRISTGEIIGTVCSFHQRVRHFDHEDVKLVSIFAERAAMAIENYQLYQQLQELNTSLESKLNQLKQSP